MATTAVSLEQFLKQADASDARLEFDEGRVIETPDPGPEHQIVVGHIISRLHQAFSGKPKAYAVGPGTNFILSDEVVRIPDVMATPTETLLSAERRQGQFVRGAPELGVEVASPSDSIVDFDRKVRQYLRAGAKAVWIVFIETRHVHVVRADESVENRRPGEEIDLSDIVPDAKIEVDALFAGLRA